MPKFLLSNVKFVYTKKAIFQRVYTLYIYEKQIREERLNMAVKNLNAIDDKLKDMYSNQITTAVQAHPYEDKSEILFAQMNFIAMANRQALHLL